MRVAPLLLVPIASALVAGCNTLRSGDGQPLAAASILCGPAFLVCLGGGLLVAEKTVHGSRGGNARSDPSRIGRVEASDSFPAGTLFVDADYVNSVDLKRDQRSAILTIEVINDPNDDRENFKHLLETRVDCEERTMTISEVRMVDWAGTEMEVRHPSPELKILSGERSSPPVWVDAIEAVCSAWVPLSTYRGKPTAHLNSSV